MITKKQNSNHITCSMNQTFGNPSIGSNFNSYSMMQTQPNHGFDPRYHQMPSSYHGEYSLPYSYQTGYHPWSTLMGHSMGNPIQYPRHPSIQQYSSGAQLREYSNTHQSTRNVFNGGSLLRTSELNPSAVEFVPRGFTSPANPYPSFPSVHNNVESRSPSSLPSNQTNHPPMASAPAKTTSNSFSFSAQLHSNANRAPPPPKSMEEMRSELLQTLQVRGKLLSEPTKDANKGIPPPVYNTKRDPRKR